MAAWMRFRGCGWPAIVEMSLAMYVPFVAMLFRLDEYTRGHGASHDESWVDAGERPTQLIGSDRSQG